MIRMTITTVMAMMTTMTRMTATKDDGHDKYVSDDRIIMITMKMPDHKDGSDDSDKPPIT